MGRSAEIAGLFLLAGLGAATTAVVAWLAGPLLVSFSGSRAGGAGNASDSATLGLVGAFLGAAMGRALVDWARTLRMARFQERFATDLRLWLYRRALDQGAAAGLRAGDLAARAAGDVLTLVRAVNLGVGQTVTSLTTVLALAIFIAWSDPTWGIAAGVGAVAVAGATLAFARRASASWHRSLTHAGRVADRTAEAVEAGPIAEVFDARGRLLGRFREDAVAAGAAALEGTRRTAWQGPALSLGAAASLAAVVLLFPAFGDVRRWSALAALVFMWRPLVALGRASQAIGAGLAAQRRLEDAFPRTVAPPRARAPSPVFQDALAVEGLSVRLGDRPVLRGVSVELYRGEVVCLVGPNGAGKSTLLLALLGLVPADADRVRVDAAPVPLGALPGLFAWVPQELGLWAGTVAENVAPADDPPDPARLEAALARAGAETVVARLPDGVRQALGNRGEPLSRGERQRLALARALYRGSPVLLLDEPFSSLDEEAADRLERRLLALGGDHTVVVATHRRSMVDRADRIWALDQGRTVAPRLGRRLPSGPPA